MTRTICFLLALAAPGLGPVLAQTAPPSGSPDPQALLDAWREAQDSAARTSGRIAFEETLDRETDLPRARMSLRIRSHVEGDPARQDWDREILEVTRNGRPVSPPDWHRLDGPRPGPRAGLGMGPGDPGTRMLYPPAFGQEIFRRLASDGEPEPDVVDGRTAWRLDLKPGPLRQRENRAGSPPRIEGLTLWFSDSDPPRLLRGLVFSSHPRTNVPSQRETVFGAFGDLDVPLRTRFDIQIEQHRRVRTYTLLSEVDVRFSDYRRIPPP